MIFTVARSCMSVILPFYGMFPLLKLPVLSSEGAIEVHYWLSVSSLTICRACMEVPLHRRKKIMNLKGEVLELLLVTVLPAAYCRLKHSYRNKLLVADLGSVLPL